jgi:hypothetical protein
MRVGLDAGVDVFAHTTLGERAPWDDALVKRMVASQVWVIPTFNILFGTDVGYRVVLAGDPAENVRHFAKVRCAFRAGKLIYASKTEKD